MNVSICAVGVAGDLREAPGPVDEVGREADEERLSLPDAQLQRLVHHRGQRQQLPVSRVPSRQLPHVSGHSRGRQLQTVPGPCGRGRRVQRGRKANQTDDRRKC